MKYKQFKEWCNSRCFDGCWSMKTACLCLHVLKEIDKLPFWKREKAWKNEEEFIIENIIIPIDNKIEEVKYEISDNR